MSFAVHAIQNESQPFLSRANSLPGAVGVARIFAAGFTLWLPQMVMSFISHHSQYTHTPPPVFSGYAYPWSVSFNRTPANSFPGTSALWKVRSHILRSYHF